MVNRVTTSGTTNDNDWYTEPQRVTKSDTTSDNEWQRVIQRMKTNESEWERIWFHNKTKHALYYYNIFSNILIIYKLGNWWDIFSI